MSRIIKCDCCGAVQDKPHGGPPKDWFSYQRSSEPLDLCPDCAGRVRASLNLKGKTHRQKAQG